MAERIAREGLNVRAVESVVQDALGKDGTVKTHQRKPRDKDPDTKAFEKELTDALGLKVEIKRSSGESGVLCIRYGNFDQLDYIRMRLNEYGS